MTALAHLSEPAFRSLLDKREKAMSVATVAAIRAGYGDTPPHEIRMMAQDGDPVAKQWVLAADQLQVARWEQKYRIDYSGSLKPIWRAA